VVGIINFSKICKTNIMRRILLLLSFMIPFVVNAQEIFWEQIRPISAQVEVSNPDNLDLFLIQDVSDNNLRKSISVSNLHQSFMRGVYPTDTISVSSTSVSPYTYYIVDASAGEVNIEVPAVGVGDTAWYSFTLKQNGNHCNISVTGGIQEINAQNTVSLSTEQSGITIKQNSADGYFIINDTRPYYRTVVLSANTDLSSGFESGALYELKPPDATDITVTIADWEIAHKGDRAKWVKFGGENSSIRIVSVDGSFDEVIVDDNTGIEIAVGDTSYLITQDSRIKPSNVEVGFYPYPTVSGFEPTYYTLFNASPQPEVTLTSIAVTSTDENAPNSLGFFINDDKALAGTLPESNFTAIGQFKLTSAFNRGIKVKFRYYEYNYGDSTLNPTFLSETSYSSPILNSSIYEQYVIGGILPANEWFVSETEGHTVVIELLAIKVGGAGGNNPTLDVLMGGLTPSKTIINLPASNISHSVLGGISAAQTGVFDGHVNNSVPLQIPELTTVERDAYLAVNDGMIIHNVDSGFRQKYEGGQWLNDVVAVFLNDLDTTGFEIPQYQVIGLEDTVAQHRADINQNASDISDHVSSTTNPHNTGLSNLNDYTTTDSIFTAGLVSEGNIYALTKNTGASATPVTNYITLDQQQYYTGGGTQVENASSGIKAMNSSGGMYASMDFIQNPFVATTQSAFELKLWDGAGVLERKFYIDDASAILTGNVSFGDNTDTSEGDLRINVGTEDDGDGITLARRGGLAGYQSNIFLEGGAAPYLVIRSQIDGDEDNGRIINRIGNTASNANFQVQQHDGTVLFSITGGTGKATFSDEVEAASFTATTGETINEFSSDSLMAGKSSTALVTEGAIVSYINSHGTPVQTLTETAGAVSWDMSKGLKAKVTIDETTVITITNMKVGAEATIRIVQGDSGDDNVTFVLSGATVEWRGDDQDLTNGSGKVDYVSLANMDGILGVTLGRNYVTQ
jgi:hypothetical protein